MSEISPLLDVKNLRTSFRTREGKVEAVKDISFSVGRGKTLGIVGESGSGKSVTSLSIMRLLATNGQSTAEAVHFHPPEQGKRDLSVISEKEMRSLRGNELAMIFQEPMSSLNPVMRCGTQVVEALRLHKQIDAKTARAKCLELFRQVQLPRVEQIFEAYPHEISGGQKQRVMIAMAICCQPSLLIADEPTTALDVTVQKEILELLQRLQAEQGMSMIFITHDLGVVAEIADELIVMFQGEIVEAGLVEDIFAEPKHPYTQGLLACRPDLTQQLSRLPTVKDFLAGKEGENRSEKEPIEPQPDKLSPILEAKDLKTWFPLPRKLFSPRARSYVKAVDDVSFSVFQGETLGLVGESGCGKTTLGRSLLRLVEPTGGGLHYKGQDVRKLNQENLRLLRKKMQIIFQDPYSSLNPRMTIGKAIQEPMMVHGIGSNARERRNRVEKLLEKVGMQAAHYERYPHEFSGGQRQRICIARALAVSPEFIICDESVSALDVSIQAQVLNLLKDLQDELGLTYIFISHDLSVVKFMSDRIMVMRAGKKVELQEAEALYRSPGSDYTRKLIEAVPVGNLESIQQAKARRASYKKM